MTTFLNLSFTVYHIGTKINNCMWGSFNKTLQSQFTGVVIVLIDVSLFLNIFIYPNTKQMGGGYHHDSSCVL